MKMTRNPYSGCVDAREAEVRRILDRYIVELVEEYDLCPWAKPARLNGEVAVAVLWGSPPIDTWTETARELVERPTTKVAMIVAPEIEADPSALRMIRNRVGGRLTHLGVAEFHPDGIIDDATPARFVPALRRSPDPLLQLVPLSLLSSVRAPPPIVDVIEQAQLIATGKLPPMRGDVADDIAEVNHKRVVAERAPFEAALAAIALDRRTSYARVGITVGTGLSR